MDIKTRTAKSLAWLQGHFQALVIALTCWSSMFSALAVVASAVGAVYLVVHYPISLPAWAAVIVLLDAAGVVVVYADKHFS